MVGVLAPASAHAANKEASKASKPASKVTAKASPATASGKPAAADSKSAANKVPDTRSAKADKASDKAGDKIADKSGSSKTAKVDKPVVGKTDKSEKTADKAEKSSKTAKADAKLDPKAAKAVDTKSDKQTASRDDNKRQAQSRSESRESRRSARHARAERSRRRSADRDPAPQDDVAAFDPALDLDAPSKDPVAEIAHQETTHPDETAKEPQVPAAKDAVVAEPQEIAAAAHEPDKQEIEKQEPEKDLAGREPSRKRGRATGSVDEKVRVRQGDSLEEVLVSHGLSADEAQQWVRVASDAYDVRKLAPRRPLTLRFDRDSRALERVLYEIDDKAQLVLEQTPRGIEARPEGLPYYVEVRGTAGKITRTMRDDAARMGVPDAIVNAAAGIFGWEADAWSDPHSTAEFRVLYENIWRAGYAYPETGKLLAAELVRDGQRSVAVYFEDREGNGGYYRPTGEAMSKAFLRYPVEFTEITSGFGWRYHPILHVGRPHKGVDFAAPTGTPVHAASDGRVVKAGWSNGFGRCIKIEHLEGYVSTYGHLSGIADGVSEGSIVERGQEIGFVGSTGMATGPHLHYEVELRGEAIDPLEMTIMSDQPVPDYLRRSFEKTKAVVAKQMAVLPVDESTRIVAGSSMAAASAAYEAE